MVAVYAVYTMHSTRIQQKSRITSKITHTNTQDPISDTRLKVTIQHTLAWEFYFSPLNFIFSV